VHIRLANSGSSFGASADQPLLDAARDAAFNLPHSCQSGNCGACKARLVRGEIHYPRGTPLGLSAAEVAEGLILLCQACARSDLVLETFEIRAADSGAPRRLPCRIERRARLSADVMGLYLRLPIAEDFRFAPGQYIDILLPGDRRRSFSIASPPHDSRPLELHVRHVPGGEFTDPLFHDLLGSLLLIEGPLGTFAYRPHAGRAPPMLLIGGGTGIAPLLCILRHVIDQGIERDMRLYWGVRAETDLYAQTTIDALSRRAAGLKYAPVLSEASAGWRGLTGWVHEAALEGIDDLASYEVYAAGPPAMIEALQGAYAVRGVSMERLYCDSFDYAEDTLVRQRMSAATKS